MAFIIPLSNRNCILNWEISRCLPWQGCAAGRTLPAPGRRGAKAQRPGCSSKPVGSPHRRAQIHGTWQWRSTQGQQDRATCPASLSLLGACLQHILSNQRPSVLKATSKCGFSFLKQQEGKGFNSCYRQLHKHTGRNECCRVLYNLICSCLPSKYMSTDNYVAISFCVDNDCQEMRLKIY